ncbi:MAG: hypothetical protein WD278_14880 [Pirellulales bacterium]
MRSPAMELKEALAQISQIREHMARTEVFRGYRSLTVGLSGALALAAAVGQSFWLPRPLEQLASYLALWIGVAVISAVVAGGEMWTRARRARSSVARQMTLLAVEQFLPSLVAGAVLTAVIVRRAAESAWMLPGLWALCFSLGVFASYRLLPRPVFWVGVYYLVCGALALAWGQGEAALSPWSMAISFGGGQLLAAAILYFTLERGSG